MAYKAPDSLFPISFYPSPAAPTTWPPASLRPAPASPPPHLLFLAWSSSPCTLTSPPKYAYSARTILPVLFTQRNSFNLPHASSFPPLLFLYCLSPSTIVYHWFSSCSLSLSTQNGFLNLVYVTDAFGRITKHLSKYGLKKWFKTQKNVHRIS